MRPLSIITVVVFFVSCSAQTQVQNETILNKNALTVEARFQAPNGFKTVKSDEHSFGHYLQHLKLKPYGNDVLLYNGKIKYNKVHASVVDMEIGTKDLQQCADAVMRLRAEYLYKSNRKKEIAFNFTNGFRAEYSEWMKGKRMVVNGNETHWEMKAEASETYSSFRKYMDLIFNYAGTKSLEKELVSVKNITDIQIGDVFIQGGSPGHAVIVVNMATNTQTGEKLFMLAQSYMPAQEIHVLNNPNNKGISPWYSANFEGELVTPEWKFEKGNLRRFE